MGSMKNRPNRAIGCMLSRVREGKMEIPVYTHVLNRGGHGVHSPLDRLRKTAGSESTGIMRTGGRPNKLETT